MGLLTDFWLLKKFRGVPNEFETIFSKKILFFQIFIFSNFMGFLIDCYFKSVSCGS